MSNHPPLLPQLLDGPHNPHPHPPAVEVALVQKLAGARLVKLLLREAP